MTTMKQSGLIVHLDRLGTRPTWIGMLRMEIHLMLRLTPIIIYSHLIRIVGKQ